MSSTAAPSNAPAERMAALAATALLGTDRAGGKGGSNAAALLLREATVLGARRRAGQRAAKAPKPIPECPVDPLPQVSAACASSLRLLLLDPDGQMVEEWAELAAAKGRRVPDGLAAPLLDWWSRRTEESAAVRAVLGVRLDWLCSLNPTWRKRAAGASIPTDLDSTWQTCATPERLALLNVVRRVEPERAEPLLRSTWEQDSADERRRFVERFEDNLSFTDEPFLEWVLNDRSKQTRAVASSLLARLPISRLAGRMVDRAAAMIRIEQGKKGLLRRVKESIVVEPPQEWDKAWERDGLEEKPPGGVGKRAWWLQQVLSAAPPQAVAARVGLTPDRLIEAIAECDFAKQGIPGLCAAAANARDESWCRALIEHLLAGKNAATSDMQPLWRCLPAPARENVLLEVLQKGKMEWVERCAALATADHRWSPEFSARICVLLTKDRPSKAPDPWSTSAALERVSRWIHPAALGAYEKLINEVFRTEPPPSAIKSIDRVRLRADMHKDFAA